MKTGATGGKTPFNFRLSPGGKMLLVRLGEHMGLTRSGVLETAIRVLAREQGLPGGFASGDEIEKKWDAFMQEDEAARSAELEQQRAQTAEKSAKGE